LTASARDVDKTCYSITYVTIDQARYSILRRAEHGYAMIFLFKPFATKTTVERLGKVFEDGAAITL
jgi:hypothetical protein